SPFCYSLFRVLYFCIYNFVLWFLVRTARVYLFPILIRANVQRFIFKSVLLVIPFICLILWVEIGLVTATKSNKTKSNISYEIKKQFAEENRHSIKLLVLGSSHAVFGVNPEFLSLKSVNLAHRIQDPYYDANITNYYLKKLPVLEKVLISVFFHNWGSEVILKFPDRMKQYELYYSIPLENKTFSITETPVFESTLTLKKDYWSEPFSISKFLHLRQYSQILALGERYKHLLDFRELQRNVESRGMSPSGWWNAGPYTGEPAWDHAIWGAGVQSQLYDEKILVKNINYLEGFIQHLQYMGIEPILFQVPVEPRFWRNIQPEVRSTFAKHVASLVAKNKLRYFDHSQDSCFTTLDYAYPYADHLNGAGANKFTKLLNAEINHNDEIKVRQSLCK
ncbi:MAG: hypothetical protein QNL04_00610, partial [SAR324 cluster bacterium]|nr:hypothetical protein [SAR324 cluster bacterium]